MKDLRFFAYMVAVADHGRFAAAARALGVTQPALSLGIKRLEMELGTRLFDRARGRVEPTAAGAAALRVARRLLGDGDELRREVSMLQGLRTGTLTVVAGTYAAEMSGYRALGRLARKNPGLRCRLDLREWNRSTDPLLTREADLALAEVTAVDSEPLLVAETLNIQPGRFFCRPGHPVLALSRPNLRQISAYPWAWVPMPPRIFRAFGRTQPAAGYLDKRHHQFVPALRVETLAGIKQVVRESDAISAAPPRLIADEVRAGTLAVIEFAPPWLRLNYGFIYLRDRTLSPAARAFMAEVRAVEAEYVHVPANRRPVRRAAGVEAP